MQKIPGSWISLSAMLLGACLLLAGQARAEDWGEDRFSSEFGQSWLTGDRPAVNLTDERWSFSLSVGRSLVHHVRSAMNTPDVVVPVELESSLLTLRFGAQSYSVNEMGSGYAIQAGLARQLNKWLALGLLADVSLSHRQLVEEGSFLYVQYDQSGNVASSSQVTYTVHHKATLYHAAPIIHAGRYFPVGAYALKPFAIAGVGMQAAQERIELASVGAEFELASRSTTDWSALYGGGLDFRFSDSGSIGVQYLIRRTITGDQDWVIGQPTARFTYLF